MSRAALREHSLSLSLYIFLPLPLLASLPKSEQVAENRENVNHVSRIPYLYSTFEKKSAPNRGNVNHVNHVNRDFCKKY